MELRPLGDWESSRPAVRVTRGWTPPPTKGAVGHQGSLWRQSPSQLARLALRVHSPLGLRPCRPMAVRRRHAFPYPGHSGSWHGRRARRGSAGDVLVDLAGDRLPQLLMGVEHLREQPLLPARRRFRLLAPRYIRREDHRAAHRAVFPHGHDPARPPSAAGGHELDRADLSGLNRLLVKPLVSVAIFRRREREAAGSHKFVRGVFRRGVIDVSDTPGEVRYDHQLWDVLQEAVEDGISIRRNMRHGPSNP